MRGGFPSSTLSRHRRAFRFQVLAEKIEQYALPELEKLAAQPPSPELARWQRLAERIMPQIEGLALQDPEGYEEMKRATAPGASWISISAGIFSSPS